MVVIDQKVTGGATDTVITSGMTASVPGLGATFTVQDDTGYPASGKFTVVLDVGQPNEEKILINSRSGTTFMVGQRGYDGTVGQAHTSGVSTVRHPLAAAIVQALIDHVDDIEADPHSTRLLNNARHDITARHQFGAALGTPGVPVAMTPDLAGSAGVGSVPARSDHAHAIAAATAVTSGLANAEGVSSSFARADHTHDQAALSINTAELVDLAVTGAKLAQITDAAKIADALLPFSKILSAASTDVSATTDFTNPPANLILDTANGGFKYAHYYKIGRIVIMWAGFFLGTVNGNISGASTAIQIDLPHAATASHRGFAAARGSVQGVGQPIFSGTAAVGAGGTSVATFATAGASAGWDGLTPFDWATGDSFDAVIIYESAA